VPHYSRISKIVVDADSAAHDRELAFWQAATGQEMEHYQRFPEYHGTDLPGTDVGLLVQHLGEGPSRLHLDIHTDDLAAEVARLEKLGATVVRPAADGAFWCVLRDPAGLLFCVVRDARLNESNAQRWD
jgi:predicted enzyme related to lactoylglutathione lyase